LGDLVDGQAACEERRHLLLALGAAVRLDADRRDVRPAGRLDHPFSPSRRPGPRGVLPRRRRPLGTPAGPPDSERMARAPAEAGFDILGPSPFEQRWRGSSRPLPLIPPSGEVFPTQSHGSGS